MRPPIGRSHLSCALRILTSEIVLVEVVANPGETKYGFGIVRVERIRSLYQLAGPNEDSSQDKVSGLLEQLRRLTLAILLLNRLLLQFRELGQRLVPLAGKSEAAVRTDQMVIDLRIAPA